MSLLSVTSQICYRFYPRPTQHCRHDCGKTCFWKNRLHFFLPVIFIYHRTSRTVSMVVLSFALTNDYEVKNQKFDSSYQKAHFILVSEN